MPLSITFNFNAGIMQIQSTSQRFPDCGDITIWGLPWLQVNFISIRVVPFGVHTQVLASLPLMDASLELLFSDVFWHYFWLSLNFQDLLKASCLWRFGTECYWWHKVWNSKCQTLLVGSIQLWPPLCSTHLISSLLYVTYQAFNSGSHS